jgi:hypothetical protein
MPEAKKASKAKSAAQPKVKVAKPAPKAEVKKHATKLPALPKKAKKTRMYTRKPRGTFADLLKKQAELEEIKKGAKADLKKQFDAYLKEADKVNAQYKELFGESIESAPKTKGARGRKGAGKIPGLKPFSLQEVEAFIDQKKSGVEIKVPGRRPKSIARMEEAYKQSDEAEGMLTILNK